MLANALSAGVFLRVHCFRVVFCAIHQCISSSTADCRQKLAPASELPKKRKNRHTAALMSTS